MIWKRQNIQPGHWFTANPELKHEGICAFLVEKSFEGVSVGRHIPKMGQRTSNTVGIHLKNVRVPKENILAEPGDLLGHDRRAVGCGDAHGFDAARAFALPLIPSRENPGCRCGEVLRGVIRPRECKLFAAVCTPQNPVGPCMVSFEGSCAAAFKYDS